MSKTTYNIKLKGYVGGADFDRNAVDSMLAANNGKQVNVLIDSLGGSLATGLSISAAFKQHGNVAVHFVGLNASAATIASIGAAHISIDAGAMYLVHQCSMAFFEWGSLNSDQFATLIADFEEAYCGEWDSEEDFARHIIDECYNIEKMMGSLANYFNYDAYARELFMYDYSMGANNNVFRNI